MKKICRNSSAFIAVISIIITCLLVFSFGCAKKEENVVKIGILTPLTGKVASWGEMQRRATDLALEKVKGIKVKVIFEDDGADPKAGVNAFKKLVDVDKVPIVVGSPASNVTLAVASIANGEKVVLLSSGSTATKVGNAGAYVFRIMPSDEVQSSIMANWAYELGYSKIAIIYEDNAWGRGLMEAFQKDFVAKGGRVVTVQVVEPGATDFHTQLTKIKAIKPNAIFAPLYTEGAGLMIKQARELGLKQQILGADVYETPELINAGGSAVEGVLYTTYGEYHGAEYQDFAKRYKDKYGVLPGIYATYCYDAFLVAVEAIQRIPKGKEINGSNIRNEILLIRDFRGVTGVSNFNGSNSASGKTFDKKIVKNGKNVPYTK